jgi:hypothetical protein
MTCLDCAEVFESGMRQTKKSISDLGQRLPEQQDREETIRSIRKGVDDANAGRIRDVGEGDSATREKLAVAPRSR